VIDEIESDGPLIQSNRPAEARLGQHLYGASLAGW
jgi:hypothetical protein